MPGPQISREWLISVGGTDIAAGQDASLSMSRDAIDVTTKDSSGDREFEYGDGEWSMEHSGLIHVLSSGHFHSSQDTLEQANQNETKVTVTFTTPDGKTYQGQALVTDVEITANLGNAVEGSFTLQGDGPLTITNP